MGKATSNVSIFMEYLFPMIGSSSSFFQLLFKEFLRVSLCYVNKSFVIFLNKQMLENELKLCPFINLSVDNLINHVPLFVTCHFNSYYLSPTKNVSTEHLKNIHQSKNLSLPTNKTSIYDNCI